MNEICYQSIPLNYIYWMFSSDMNKLLNERFFYSSVRDEIIHIAFGLFFILLLSVIYHVSPVTSASISILKKQNAYCMGGKI